VPDQTLEELCRRLQSFPQRWERARVRALRQVSINVIHGAQEKLGYYQPGVAGFDSWAQLSPITQRIRESQGYSPNDPLLRGGDLRNSYEGSYDEFSMVVGSDEESAYQTEFGNERQPARSVLGPAMITTMAENLVILGSYLASEVTDGSIPVRRGARSARGVAP
jgi:hypothetical protein